MDNNTKFFWLLRKQSLEEQLEKCKKLKEMIDLSQHIWSEDCEAVLVAAKLAEKIEELEKDIEETPDLS